MSIKSGAGRRGGNLGRKGKNTFITKSGQAIRINRSLVDKVRSRRATYAKQRAQRLAGMPKSRVKRFFYRLQPKRLYHYWFSREGAIMALKVFGIGTLILFLLTVGVFAYFRKDLPDITDISGNNIGGSVRYYDRTGKTLLWEDVNGIKRIPVQDDQISTYIKQATVAVEDKDFFHHGGFDVRGITRAAFNNAFGHGGTTQGGSTITQQLVRLTQDEIGKQQTISRKVKELILAVELEREYNKQQILTGYLNAAPYGGIENGVEAAARDYFQKSAKDLTLDEAAMLAAIPKAPSFYSKYSEYFDKQATIDRQHYILDLMVDQNMITPAQRDAAVKVNTIAKIKPRPTQYAGIKAPYFVLAAQKELEATYSDSANRSGWKVITTVDLKLQKLAEDAVRNDIPTLNAYGADEAAFAAEDVKTGEMVALVGGVDFTNPDHGKINYAHDVFIAPGSSFKPYDYTALIDKSTNAGAGSVLYDSQGPLPGYACTIKGLPPPKGNSNCLQDYDFRNPGPMTLRYALGGSRNIPAVKANLIAGTQNVIDMASAMMANTQDKAAGRLSYNCYKDGADLSPSADREKLQASTTQCYGASAIGDGAFLHLDDHVNGLATLARLGKAIPRTYILKILNSSDKQLFEYTPPAGEQVVRPDSAYIVNNMASDPNASYLPSSYKFQSYNGWKFAVKTGTTNNGYDGLMASWSSQYAAISWVGYHTRNQALGGFMEYMTEPITRPWMQGAHDALHTTPKNWEKPSGVQTLPAYVVRVNPGIGAVVPSASTDLYPSWYQKPKTSTTNKNIDIVSNKLATECTPPRAIKESSTTSTSGFSVDIFVDATTANTSQKDDVHHCDDKKPSVSLDDSSIDCPDSGCVISAHVSHGTHPLSSSRFPGKVTFSVDGREVGSKTVSSDGQVSINYVPDFSGTKTLGVTVVDSVLYENSDSGEISATAGGSVSLVALTPDGDSLKRSDVNFTWTDLGPGVLYNVFWKCSVNGSATGISGTSYNPDDNALYIGLYPRNCTWSVESSTGQHTNTNTFKLTGP